MRSDEQEGRRAKRLEGWAAFERAAQEAGEGSVGAALLELLANYGGNTLAAYRTTARHLAAHLGAGSPATGLRRPLRSVSREDLAGFQRAMSAGRRSPASARRHMAVIKRLFDGTPPLPERGSPELALPADEDVVALRAAARMGPEPLRNVALVDLFACAGLRVSEALALSASSFGRPNADRLEVGSPLVVGTEAARREIPLYPPLLGSLEELQRGRGRAGQLLASASRPLRGEPLSRRGVGDIFGRLGGEGGLTPRGLRRYCRLRLQRFGVEEPAIAAALGVAHPELKDADAETRVELVGEAFAIAQGIP